MVFEELLPRFKFICGQIVAMTGLFQAYQSTAHPGYHLSFTTDNPTCGPGGGQVAPGHGFAGWPDYPDLMGRALALISIRFLVLHLFAFDLLMAQMLASMGSKNSS